MNYRRKSDYTSEGKKILAEIMLVMLFGVGLCIGFEVYKHGNKQFIKLQVSEAEMEERRAKMKRAEAMNRLFQACLQAEKGHSYRCRPIFDASINVLVKKQ